MQAQGSSHFTWARTEHPRGTPTCWLCTHARGTFTCRPHIPEEQARSRSPFRPSPRASVEGPTPELPCFLCPSTPV